MNTPVQRARHDLERIDEQMKLLQAERESVLAFIRMYDRYAGQSEAMATAPTIHTAPLKTRVLEATIAFLRERGKPAFMTEIYPMLVGKGLTPKGSYPKQQVSSMLGRDGRVEYSGDKGWWLKGVELFGTVSGSAGGVGLNTEVKPLLS